jgi:hypothetical protein
LTAHTTAIDANRKKRIESITYGCERLNIANGATTARERSPAN